MDAQYSQNSLKSTPKVTYHFADFGYLPQERRSFKLPNQLDADCMNGSSLLRLEFNAESCAFAYFRTFDVYFPSMVFFYYSLCQRQS